MKHSEQEISLNEGLNGWLSDMKTCDELFSKPQHSFRRVIPFYDLQPAAPHTSCFNVILQKTLPLQNQTVTAQTWADISHSCHDMLFVIVFFHRVNVCFQYPQRSSNNHVTSCVTTAVAIQGIQCTCICLGSSRISGHILQQLNVGVCVFDSGPLPHFSFFHLIHSFLKTETFILKGAMCNSFNQAELNHLLQEFSKRGGRQI